MKTLKQIADELGVSKDKVKYRVRNLPSNCIVKQGNITYITDAGIPILSGLLLGNAVNFSPFVSEKFTCLFPDGDKKRIADLEAEIEKLKWQLSFERATAEEKLEMAHQHHQEVMAQARQTISDCEKWRLLLEREQQLRLADKAQILQQLTSGTADQQPDTDAEPRKGFFAKWFSKI